MKRNKKDAEIRVRIGAKDQARIDRLRRHYDLTVSELIRQLIWQKDNDLFHPYTGDKKNG